MPKPKLIVVQWVKETAYGYGTSMQVTYSTHSQYTVGTRFDFGFFNIATKQGYTIISIPEVHDD